MVAATGEEARRKLLRSVALHSPAHLGYGSARCRGHSAGAIHVKFSRALCVLTWYFVFLFFYFACLCCALRIFYSTLMCAVCCASNISEVLTLLVCVSITNYSQAYKDSVSVLNFSGPTNFAPLIQTATASAIGRNCTYVLSIQMDFCCQ